MRLFVIRHAEAAPGAPDDLRQLTAAGRSQAQALARRLADGGVRPDVILTSPLVRARETGEVLAAELGCASEESEALAPGATADTIRTAVAGRGETVLVVGHQPDCGRIAAALGGGSEPPFPPAGVAELQLDS